MTHNWLDARGECELYGGWLVQINNMKEYNCIMRHGISSGLNTDYWIDVNDVANTGVWTHAYDDSEVLFFPPRVTCVCSDSQSGCSNGGDAYILKIEDDRHNRGTYCDQLTSYAFKFICEAVI